MKCYSLIKIKVLMHATVLINPENILSTCLWKKPDAKGHYCVIPFNHSEMSRIGKSVKTQSGLGFPRRWAGRKEGWEMTAKDWISFWGADWTDFWITLKTLICTFYKGSLHSTWVISQ